MNKWLVSVVLSAGIGVSCMAQDFAIRSNILSDAFTNVNVGIEVGLAPRWSLDVGGELNAWKFSHGRRWKHWGVMPEARYWLCDRLAGHFVAVDAFTGQYNVAGVGRRFHFLGTDFGAAIDSRYQGWFAGAGIAYGYDFVIGRHWNLEAEIGAGYARMTYDRFACEGCGRLLESGGHDYFGLTKAAVSLVYVF